MDLNPVFTPAATGGELALFASQAFLSYTVGSSIPKAPNALPSLVVKDYDSAMNLIIEADVLTRGLLVGNEQWC